MQPILFVLPLPNWSVPLGPTLALLALLAVGTLAVVLPRALRLRGALAAALSLGLCAALVWGRRYALGPLPISAFGALLALGLSLGIATLLVFGRQLRVPRARSTTLIVVVGASALVGARLAYVLVASESELRWSQLFGSGQGGLSAYGALLAAVLVLYWRERGAELSRSLDLFAVGAAAALPFAKIGCYLHGCDFGTTLSATASARLQKLGTFPHWSNQALGEGSPAWWQQVRVEHQPASALSALPVHPVQLYEAAGDLFLYFLVARVLVRRTTAGEGFFAFVWGYGVVRGLSELVRGDLDRGLLGPALDAQVAAGLCVLLLAMATISGPIRSIHRTSWRRAAQLAALAPVIPAAITFRPDERLSISLSLLLAIVSSLLAGVAWGRLLHRPGLVARFQGANA